jgi:hypothetical protein
LSTATWFFSLGLDPATERFWLYDPGCWVFQAEGLVILALIQGFAVALGAGWRPGWQGMAGGCVVLAAWSLTGAGILPLPGQRGPLRR